MNKFDTASRHNERPATTLTVRELFAAVAMHAIAGDVKTEDEAQQIALRAFIVADAMCSESEIPSSSIVEN